MATPVTGSPVQLQDIREVEAVRRRLLSMRSRNPTIIKARANAPASFQVAISCSQTFDMERRSIRTQLEGKHESLVS